MIFRIQCHYTLHYLRTNQFLFEFFCYNFGNKKHFQRVSTLKQKLYPRTIYINYFYFQENTIIWVTFWFNCLTLSFEMISISPELTNSPTGSELGIGRKQTVYTATDYSVRKLSLQNFQPCPRTKAWDAFLLIVVLLANNSLFQFRPKYILQYMEISLSIL